MKITLQDIGKKWGKDWLYRNVSLIIEPNKPLVLLGSNGSGKSTLLKIVSGLLSPTEGIVSWQITQTEVPIEKRYLHASFAAPYLQLYEELSMQEAFALQHKLKPLSVKNASEFCEKIGLQVNPSKVMYSFSSGMKQRVKLGFALLSNTSFVFLDEPCTNLDDDGTKTYQSLLNQCIDSGKIVVIASNADLREYPSSAEQFNVQQFSP